MNITIISGDDTELTLATKSDLRKLREHFDKLYDELGMASLRALAELQKKVRELSKKIDACDDREITDPELLNALSKVKGIMIQLADIIPGGFPDGRPLTDFPLPPEKLP